MTGFRLQRCIFGSTLIVALGAGCGGGGATIVSVAHPEAEELPRITMAYGGEEDPPAGFERSRVPQFVLDVVAPAVRGEVLDRLGYQAGDVESADVVLYAGAGGRLTVEERTVRQPQSRATVALGLPDYEQTYEERVAEGTLVFDAFHRETGVHLWHGQIAAVVDENPDPDDFDADALRADLSEMFASFPAAGPGTTTSGGEVPEDASGESTPIDDSGEADDLAAIEGASSDVSPEDDGETSSED
ncbi:MAG: hypothetical protein AAGF12_21765 [Myxococcota bacterium]